MANQVDILKLNIGGEITEYDFQKIYIGTNAPEDTSKLWIDTDDSTETGGSSSSGGGTGVSGDYLPLSGGNMSGTINMNSNRITNLLAPSANNDAATKAYVDSKVGTGTSSGTGLTQVFHAGTTAPSNTNLLWIDTNTSTGGLKYYNGSVWAYVPIGWAT